jgi:hypothetical protein
MSRKVQSPKNILGSTINSPKQDIENSILVQSLHNPQSCKSSTISPLPIEQLLTQIQGISSAVQLSAQLRPPHQPPLPALSTPLPHSCCDQKPKVPSLHRYSDDLTATRPRKRNPQLNLQTARIAVSAQLSTLRQSLHQLMPVKPLRK